MYAEIQLSLLFQSESDTLGKQISIFYCVSIILLISTIALGNIYLLKKTKEKYPEISDIYPYFKTLYTLLEKYKLSSLYYKSVFIARRLLVAIVYLVFQNYQGIQLILQIKLSFLMIVYLVKYPPFESRILNIIELMSEGAVLICQYYLLIFALGTLIDESQKASIGLGFCILIICHFIITLIAKMFSKFLKLYPKIRDYWHKFNKKLAKLKWCKKKTQKQDKIKVESPIQDKLSEIVVESQIKPEEETQATSINRLQKSKTQQIVPKIISPRVIDSIINRKPLQQNNFFIYAKTKIQAMKSKRLKEQQSKESITQSIVLNQLSPGQNEGFDNTVEYLPYQLNEDDLVQLTENRRESRNSNTLKEHESMSDKSSPQVQVKQNNKNMNNNQEDRPTIQQDFTKMKFEEPPAPLSLEEQQQISLTNEIKNRFMKNFSNKVDLQENMPFESFRLKQIPQFIPQRLRVLEEDYSKGI